MKQPRKRIYLGATVLASVVFVAAWGFHLLGGYPWIESLWVVVVTISGVGYGERSGAPQAVQLWTLLVIVVGTLASIYTLGALVQLLMAGEIDRALGRRRMQREIDHLTRHVIVCGFGRVGQVVTADLASQAQPFVIIDRDPVLCDDARQEGYLCIEGDATAEETLTAAGIVRARALFTGLPSDPDNVYITLTARNLCPEVFIIGRAETLSTEKKLKQAGANRVLMPAVVGAKQLSRMIMRPATADLIELVAESSYLDFDLEELQLVSDSPLIGRTLSESGAHRKYRLLIVAVKDVGGNMTFNPAAEYTLQPDDVAIVLGHSADIKRFRADQRL